MSRKSGTKGLRDDTTIANSLELQYLSPVLPSPIVSPAVGLPTNNDLRYWDPEEPDQPARTQSGRRAARTLSDPFGSRIRNRQTKALVAFQPLPRDPVTICVRRKARKEVLHALRKTGRGGARKRPYRRNWRSDIKC